MWIFYFSLTEESILFTISICIKLRQCRYILTKLIFRLFNFGLSESIKIISTRLNKMHRFYLNSPRISFWGNHLFSKTLSGIFSISPSNFQTTLWNFRECTPQNISHFRIQCFTRKNWSQIYSHIPVIICIKLYENEFLVSIVMYTHEMKNVLSPNPKFANSTDFNRQAFRKPAKIKKEGKIETVRNGMNEQKFSIWCIWEQ